MPAQLAFVQTVSGWQQEPPQAREPAQQTPTPLLTPRQVCPSQQSGESEHCPPKPTHPAWQTPPTQTPEQHSGSLEQVEPVSCLQAPPQHACPAPQVETQVWLGPQVRQ